MTIESLEKLELRLRELPITTPDPASVTARVLAAQRQAERPKRTTTVGRRLGPSLVLRPLAAVLVGAVVMWAVLYFSPATGAALAGAPAVGGFSSFVLKEVGLDSGGSVTSEDAAAAQSGVTVRLVGATASPLRTVLLVNISPASALPVGTTLTDQFGISYYTQSGYGDTRTGDWAIIFPPPSFVTAALGMRFTLTFDAMEGGSGHLVPGTWKVAGTVLSHPGRTIAAPASASVGGGTISFSSAMEAGGMLEMTAHVRGIAVPADMFNPTKKTGPQELPVTITVTDSSGKQLDASGGPYSEDGGWAIDIVAYGLVDHGSYTIAISIVGAGTVTRTITI